MENNTPVEQSTPAASAADMSLADYRATREAAAAPPAKEDAIKTTPATGSEELEGSDAPGDAKPTQEQAAGESSDAGVAAKKKGGFQKKIEKLESEKADLERRLAEKEATPTPAAKPAEGAAAPKPAADEPPPFEKPKPKLEDFDGIEEFTEALNDWKYDERKFRDDWTKGKAEFDRKQAEATTKWKEQVGTSKAQHADYDEVLSAVDDIQLSRQHQAIFLESEHGAELIYQLAQDRETLQRIASLSATAAAREIGKLEASLQSAAPETRNSVSRAPRPFRSLSGAAAPGTLNVEAASLSDYRKARESGRLR